MQLDEQEISLKLAKLGQVKSEMAKVIVGQTEVVEQLLICMLAGGHCLLEGVPGLAKTLMVSTLARTLTLDFHRVQFTPDLMPSDIIGTEILEQDHTTGKRFFKFQQGPVFSNILLADEINRTPPKTQAALLEAMQEKKISYGGTSYDLPKPFFVLATQNPVEQAGTYPLPEAQLDRFLMFVQVAYPSKEEEVEILQRTTGSYTAELTEVLGSADIIELQKLVRMVELAPALLGYIADLARASRLDEPQSELVKRYVRWGAGPRAGQALALCAKARAILDGRFAVSVEDVKAVSFGILRHRILLNFHAQADNITPDDVIQDMLLTVKAPQSPLG